MEQKIIKIIINLGVRNRLRTLPLRAVLGPSFLSGGPKFEVSGAKSVERRGATFVVVCSSLEEDGWPEIVIVSLF